MFRDLDNEMWLVNRLKAHGEVFAGLTDREVRKERIREAIMRVGSEIVVGRGVDRKPVTYREAFERLFGEPLTSPAIKSAKGRAPPSVESAPGAQEA